MSSPVIDDNSKFAKQDSLAQDIIDNYRGKAIAVRKTTRAAATTSLVRWSIERGQKTVIVVPTIRIFDGTVIDSLNYLRNKDPKTVRIARIKKNLDLCPKSAAEVAQNIGLQKLPFHGMGKCENCSCNDPKSCLYQELITNDWDVLGITYQKLKALERNRHKNEKSRILYRMVTSCQNILFDEASSILGSLPYVEFKGPQTFCLAQLNKEFNVTQRIADSSSKPEKTFWESIKRLADKIDANVPPECKNLHVKSPFTEDEQEQLQKRMASYYKIVKQLAMNNSDVTLLCGLLPLLEASWLSVSHYMKTKRNNTREEKIVVTALVERQWPSAINTSSYIGRVIQSVSKQHSAWRTYSVKGILNDKLVAFIDAGLPKTRINTAIGTPQLHIEDYPWGDPLETNKKQLVICDTKKISNYRFFGPSGKQFQAQIKDAIQEISACHDAEKIIVVSLGKAMHEEISHWKEQEKSIDSKIHLTYYRSTETRGITPYKDRNVMILIGGPYIPKNAGVDETTEPVDIEMGLFTQREHKNAEAFRESNIESTFVNMIGRVKDPLGEKQSFVYCLGITQKEVKKWLNQKSVPPPIIVAFPNKTKVNAEDFGYVADLLAKFPFERWNNFDDVLYLARMIHRLKIINKELGAWQVVYGEGASTEETVRIANANKDVLESYGFIVEEFRKGRTIFRPKK